MFQKNAILEGSGLDFGGSGPRFWRLQASIFEPPGQHAPEKLFLRKYPAISGFPPPFLPSPTACQSSHIPATRGGVTPIPFHRTCPKACFKCTPHSSFPSLGCARHSMEVANKWYQEPTCSGKMLSPKAFVPKGYPAGPNRQQAPKCENSWKCPYVLGSHT